MCGIVGFWQRAGGAVALTALERATTALRHRGPDDEGYLLVDPATGRCASAGGSDSDPSLDLPPLRSLQGESFALGLGHRRLSILDLSPAGHQPLFSPDGRLSVVYNGEIYNYRELREELRGRGHRFRTGTDTEVLLAAYATWGVDCLHRLNGMWAFALWDATERKLVCARDRFGIKPLYFAEEGGLLALASEPKALLAYPGLGAEPNEGVLFDYLTLKQEDHTDETFYRSVRKLPPGHCFEVSARAPTAPVAPKAWWRVSVNAELGRPEGRAAAGAVAEFRELFADAVRLRLRSDVPLGTCLSGGLDSSAIVGVANQLLRQETGVDTSAIGERQKTFSARYRGSRVDEGEYMRAVVEATGAQGHEVFPGRVQTVWDELSKLVWHQDEPFASSSLYAQWNVMRLARDHGVTVLLDGQGADELLAGYHRYYGSYLAQVWRERGAAAAWYESCLAAQGSDRKPALLFGWALRERARAALPPGLRRTVNRASARMEPWLSPDFVDAQRHRVELLRQETHRTQLAPRLAEDLTRWSLPALLRYEDRNSMAFSRESRVPFLDYRLVEYVFSLPACHRIGGGWTKWVLRAATGGLVPDTVRWRRRKIGFATPESRWLQEGRPFFAALLADRPLRTEPYVDTTTLRALLARGQTARLWRWATAEVWLRTCGKSGGRTCATNRV